MVEQDRRRQRDPQAAAARTLSEDERSEALLRSRQEAANVYKPDRVRLLLIAHAPPSDASRYFYFEEVGTQDALFRHVVKGLWGSIPGRSAKPAWLNRLRAEGVFLIDVLESPFDGSDLSAHVPAVLSRCQQLAPQHVILIKADVYDSCFEPLRAAGLPVVKQRVYFPGSGRQGQFESGFASALRQIGWGRNASVTSAPGCSPKLPHPGRP